MIEWMHFVFVMLPFAKRVIPPLK